MINRHKNEIGRIQIDMISLSPIYRLYQVNTVDTTSHASRSLFGEYL